jgi:hypothetical protein
MIRWMTILIIFIVCIAFAGCSTSSTAPKGELVSSGVGSGLAIVPPQIDGTIQSIQAGNPSYVVLKDVVETVANNSKIEDEIHKSEDRLMLPNGHFVSPNHWQSEGETLDFFIGDSFSLMKNTGEMSNSSPNFTGQPFAGIVQSINNNKLVIQKVLYDTGSNDSHAMKYTNQSVTIHLAPYTKISFYGDGSNRSKLSQIAKGDSLLFILIGHPTEYIATQITCFSSISDAGWHMEDS